MSLIIILLSGDLESEVDDASSFADFPSRVMSYDNSELSIYLPLAEQKT